MKKLFTLVALLFLLWIIIPMAWGQNADQANPDLDLSAAYTPPTDSLVLTKLDQWQDLKFGMIIHWGLYSVPGIVESWSICSEDEEWIPRDSTMRYDDYKRWYWDLNQRFNPVSFNPEQWASVAKNAGMKYVVFTTKHHDGFAMYNTQFSDYSIANGPFKNNPKMDITQYVFEAFRKENMMIGAYYSKPDWHSQDYWWDRYATPDRHVNYKIEKHPYRWERFKNFVYNQIDEITSNYGAIDILWLDGGWVRAPQEDINMDRIAQKARKNQPGLLIVDRTVTGPYENYRTPEKMIPECPLSYPWETCMPLGQDWGYVPGSSFKSANEVINTLIEVVAKGGSLLLGVGPTPEGLIEQAVVERLNEIGLWMKSNGKAIYNTRALRTFRDEHVWFTGAKEGKTTYAIIMADADNPIPNTVTWQGYAPQDKKDVRLLSTGETLKCTVKKSNVVTVTLPKEIQGTMQSVAIEFEAK